MKEGEDLDTRRKILARAELARRLAEHRARGERVVLATGGFDLLDAGQARWLERVRREADVLAVAVDSDDQMRVHRGGDLPIVGAEGRAQLVAALGAVNYVIVRGGDEDALLEALQPDVFAPGGDAAAGAAESEAARKAGIRVVPPVDAGGGAARDVVSRLRGMAHD